MASEGHIFDAEYLKKHYPDSELDGVFPKAPDLKLFFASSGARAAVLQLQP